MIFYYFFHKKYNDYEYTLNKALVDIMYNSNHLVYIDLCGSDFHNSNLVDYVYVEVIILRLNCLIHVLCMCLNRRFGSFDYDS